MCFFFRKKHGSDTQTDMVSSEKKKQQEAVTSVESEGSVDTAHGKGSKPLASSPVTHLWTSEDGCRPLVRPEDATSTGMSHVYVVFKVDSLES